MQVTVSRIINIEIALIVTLGSYIDKSLYIYIYPSIKLVLYIFLSYTYILELRTFVRNHCDRNKALISSLKESANKEFLPKFEHLRRTNIY